MLAEEKPAGRSGHDPRPRPFKKIERRLNHSGEQLTTTDQASFKMASVRQTGTKPEMAVRAVLAGLRMRYTTSNRDLPGSPDLANRARRFAVFVHGCYWHHHVGCRLATVPHANRAFWEAKFFRNRARDAQAMRDLRALGFTVVVVWQCQTTRPEALQRRLARLLSAVERGS